MSDGRVGYAFHHFGDEQPRSAGIRRQLAGFRKNLHPGATHISHLWQIPVVVSTSNLHFRPPYTGSSAKPLFVML